MKPIFFTIFLSLCVYVTQAQSSQWLNAMIAQKEVSKSKENTANTINTINTANNSFFTTHGLIFFYGSQCPHCQQFAPILKKWVVENNAPIMPLSLDNKPLPEFTKYKPATTQWLTAAFGSNAINYPAVFLINPKTKVLYPVGFGSMSASELNERMILLIPKIKAYETKGSLS